MRKGWLLFFIIWIAVNINAQELLCSVDVNSEKVLSDDASLYEDFKKNVSDFLNKTSWSDIKLSKKERIKCSFLFIFLSADGDKQTGQIQIVAQRPVYGTSLLTTILNVKQTVSFNYQENQDLVYNEMSIDDNLTAILAFWSNVIIGLDLDSFSKLGGTDFFDKAQNIVNLAQTSGGDLWKAQQDKNNWGWSKFLNDANNNYMRLLSYKYHRLGLDIMYIEPDEGKKSITESLEYLNSAKKADSRSPLIQNFYDSKADELVNIYSKSNVAEKVKVYDLLINIFPGSSKKLKEIKQRR